MRRGSLTRLFGAGKTHIWPPAAVGKNGGTVGEGLHELFGGQLARTLQIGAPEIGGCHLCAAEAGAGEDGPAEVSTAQARLPEIGFAEIGVAEDAL